MAIDRVKRARRRRERRRAAGSAAEADSARQRMASASLEVEGLFNPGSRHQMDRSEWVAVAREDDREAGAGPLDLDSGIVHLDRADPF